MGEDQEDYIKVKRSELEKLVEEEVSRGISQKREEGEKSWRGKKLSRRSFLKKIGLGTAGIGALSLAPAASQLKLTKNGITGASNISTDIYVDAGEYSSLQSAIDDMPNRDAQILRLPPETYDESISIDNGSFEIVGSAGMFSAGTEITGTVAVNTGRIKIQGIRIFPGDTSSGVVGLQVNSNQVVVQNCNFTYADKHIVIDGEHCKAINNYIAADNTGTVDIELTSNTYQTVVTGNLNWSNNSFSISINDNGSQNVVTNNT